MPGEVAFTPPWLSLEVDVRYGGSPREVILELVALSARLGVALSAEVEGVTVAVEPKSKAIDVLREHAERVARANAPPRGHP